MQPSGSARFERAFHRVTISFDVHLIGCQSGIRFFKPTALRIYNFAIPIKLRITDDFEHLLETALTLFSIVKAEYTNYRSRKLCNSVIHQHG